MQTPAATVLLSTACAGLVSAAFVFALTSGNDRATPPSASLAQGDLLTRIDRLERALDEVPAPLTSSAVRAAEHERADPATTRTPVAVSTAAGSDLEAILGRLDRVEVQLEALRQDPIDRGFSFLNSKSARARREGIELLKRFAAFDPRAREEIRGMLRDEDASVRREAVDALGDIRDADSLGQVAALTDDTDAGVRREAIDTLRDVLRRMPEDTPQRAAALAAIARRVHDGDRRVREEMADALGDLGSAEANSTLAQLLGDSEEGVREEALDALRRTADASVVPALQQFYATTDDGGQRMSAAIALARAGQPGAFQREAVGLVETVRGSGNDRERSRAVWLLGQVDSESYRQVLTQALEDPSERVRRAARRVLRRRGG